MINEKEHYKFAKHRDLILKLAFCTSTDREPEKGNSIGARTWLERYPMMTRARAAKINREKSY
jgi:hypothetical protein